MRAPSFNGLRVFLLGLVVAAGACSSSGGNSGADADAFVGTWTFQSGAITPACSLVMLDPIDMTGDVVTMTKTDANHVTMMISGNGVMCDVAFAVDGKTATAAAGQTCAISASGYNAVVNVSSWTMTLSGSNDIGMSMMGTTSVTAMGFTINCAPTATGTMVRSSSDAAQSG
jgi:hypothetical protein